MSTRNSVISSGWRGGLHGQYLDEVRNLDPETVRMVRDEFDRHQKANLQTRPTGALIILNIWRGRGQGDAKTLEFILRYFEKDRGPNESNLTGMIGYCKQLLFDMGVE